MTTLSDLHARIHAAQHAMQSGVATKMAIEPGETSPKHLRVGVNAAMVGNAALARLLIAKGLITEEEYFAELADGMEAEQRLYEQFLTEYFEKPVTLS
jgi:hypothetical protein